MTMFFPPSGAEKRKIDAARDGKVLPIEMKRQELRATPFDWERESENESERRTKELGKKRTILGAKKKEAREANAQERHKVGILIKSVSKGFSSQCAASFFLELAWVNVLR